METKRYKGVFYFDTIVYTTLSMNNHNTNLLGKNYYIYNRFTQTMFRYTLSPIEKWVCFGIWIHFCIHRSNIGLKYRMPS